MKRESEQEVREGEGKGRHLIILALGRVRQGKTSRPLSSHVVSCLPPPSSFHFSHSLTLRSSRYHAIRVSCALTSTDVQTLSQNTSTRAKSLTSPTDVGSPDDESPRPTPPDLERLISPNEVANQVTRQSSEFEFASLSSVEISRLETCHACMNEPNRLRTMRWMDLIDGFDLSVRSYL